MIRRRDDAEGGAPAGNGGDHRGGAMGEEKVVVVLPYCVVHPRIDLQVCGWVGRAANRTGVYIIGRRDVGAGRRFCFWAFVPKYI